MKVQCAYCKKTWNNNKRLPPTLPKGSVSHGICKDCVSKVNAELDALIGKKN